MGRSDRAGPDSCGDRVLHNTGFRKEDIGTLTLHVTPPPSKRRRRAVLHTERTEVRDQESEKKVWELRSSCLANV